MNHRINPCAWVDQGLALSPKKARLTTKTPEMIGLSSRVKNVVRRAFFASVGVVAAAKDGEHYFGGML